MERFAFLAEATPFGLAHRGGNEVAAENTVAAFEHAVSLGFDHLETDVHCTLDGVLVAFHDAGLERVAGLPGTIADHTWATLSQVEIGDGQRIPTMASLLETFPTTRFNIDPKADAAVEPLIKLLRLHEAIDRVCIGSFSDDRIGRLSAALGPGLCTSAGPRHIAALWAAAHTSRAIGAVARSGPVRRIAEQHGCLQVPDHQGRQAGRGATHRSRPPAWPPDACGRSTMSRRCRPVRRRGRCAGLRQAERVAPRARRASDMSGGCSTSERRRNHQACYNDPDVDSLISPPVPPRPRAERPTAWSARSTISPVAPVCACSPMAVTPSTQPSPLRRRSPSPPNTCAAWVETCGPWYTNRAQRRLH
ncbi:MAG: glycerophosphodiester phosphodiesterase family protein [Acidimicrobiales bacterium]